MPQCNFPGRGAASRLAQDESKASLRKLRLGPSTSPLPSTPLDSVHFFFNWSLHCPHLTWGSVWIYCVHPSRISFLLADWGWPKIQGWWSFLKYILAPFLLLQKHCTQNSQAFMIFVSFRRNEMNWIPCGKYKNKKRTYLIYREK